MGQRLGTWLERQDADTLPVLPESRPALARALGRGSVTTNRIRDLVLCDPALMVAVLRNAAGHHEAPAAPETISHAILLMGAESPLDLIAELPTTGDLPGEARAGYEAVACRAAHAGLHALQWAEARHEHTPEQIGVVASLRHLGRLALWACDPEAARRVTEHGGDREAARAVLGFCHDELGEALARRMGLAPELCETLDPLAPLHPHVAGAALAVHAAEVTTHGWHGEEALECAELLADYLKTQPDDAGAQLRARAAGIARLSPHPGAWGTARALVMVTDPGEAVPASAPDTDPARIRLKAPRSAADSASGARPIPAPVATPPAAPKSAPTPPMEAAPDHNPVIDAPAIREQAPVSTAVEDSPTPSAHLPAQTPATPPAVVVKAGTEATTGTTTGDDRRPVAESAPETPSADTRPEAEAPATRPATEAEGDPEEPRRPERTPPRPVADATGPSSAPPGNPSTAPGPRRRETVTGPTAERDGNMPEGRTRGRGTRSPDATGTRPVRPEARGGNDAPRPAGNTAPGTAARATASDRPPRPSGRPDAPAAPKKRVTRTRSDQDPYKQCLATLGAYRDRRIPVHEMLARLLSGMRGSTGLERVMFCMLANDRKRLSTRFMVDEAGADNPAERGLNLNLDRPHLFTRLMKRPQAVWLNDETHAKLWPLVPSRVRKEVGDGTFVAMSLFVKNKPLGVIYGDSPGNRTAMDPAGYVRFKRLCGDTARALEQARG